MICIVVHQELLHLISVLKVTLFFIGVNIFFQPWKMNMSNVPVVSADWQKHLGMYLDKALNFNLHVKKKMFKAMKGICVIQKLSKALPGHSRISIYKSFVRPHVDYGDIIYGQPNNESFTHNIERIQYNAALAITSAIKGASLSNLYSELGVESTKIIF